MTMFRMLCLHCPSSKDSFVDQTHLPEPSLHERMERMMKAKDVPQNAIDIVLRMVRVKPADRPMFSEILTHPFFAPELEAMAKTGTEPLAPDAVRAVLKEQEATADKQHSLVHVWALHALEEGQLVHAGHGRFSMDASRGAAIPMAEGGDEEEDERPQKGDDDILGLSASGSGSGSVSTASSSTYSSSSCSSAVRVMTRSASTSDSDSDGGVVGGSGGPSPDREDASRDVGIDRSVGASELEERSWVEPSWEGEGEAGGIGQSPMED